MCFILYAADLNALSFTTGHSRENMQENLLCHDKINQKKLSPVCISVSYGQLSLRAWRSLCVLRSIQPTRLEVTLCSTVNSAYETGSHSVFYGQLSLRDWRLLCVLRDWRSLFVLRSTQPTRLEVTLCSTRLEVTLCSTVNSAYETGGHSASYGQLSLRDWRSLCVLRSTQPTRLEVTLCSTVNSAYETGGYSAFFMQFSLRSSL